MAAVRCERPGFDPAPSVAWQVVASEGVTTWPRLVTTDDAATETSITTRVCAGPY